MKSKKAQEYLNGASMHPNSPLAKDQQFVWRDYSIIKAVEIAESDRDAKAVEAFRESCPYHFEGWCHKYSSENEAECEGNYDCGHQDNFIQKLNEE